VSGAGRLQFEVVSGKTVAKTVFAESPLRFLTPGNRGSAAWVYMSSFGGGLVGGDQLEIGIDVGPGAQAVLLSQSSNKVYRSELASGQAIRARIGRGASFVAIPDPTVCFEGSKFSQTQSYDLEEGASLALVDTVHCGRHASGERWLFDSYRNRVEVRREERPIFFESLLLDSGAGALAGRLGRFNVIALALLLGPEWSAAAESVRAGFSEKAAAGREDLVMSASAVGGEGVVLRAAGVSTEEVGLALRRHLHEIPRKLGDNPWARKG
jgi:urease accessory protein